MKKHKQNKQKNRQLRHAENALILEGHRLMMTLEKWGGLNQTQAQPRSWVYHKITTLSTQQVKPREIHRKPANLTSSWDQKLGTKSQPAPICRETAEATNERGQLQVMRIRRVSMGLNLLPRRPSLSTQPPYPEPSSRFQHGCRLQMQDLLCDRKRQSEPDS